LGFGGCGVRVGCVCVDSTHHVYNGGCAYAVSTHHVHIYNTTRINDGTNTDWGAEATFRCTKGVTATRVGFMVRAFHESVW
jgi:hypothetical protein